MKELFRNKLVLLIFPVLLLAGCTSGEKHAQQEGTRYTCPMHPQIVAEEPGICPICKMDLVPVSRAGERHRADDSLAYLVKPTNRLVISGIRTVRPSRGKRFGEVSLEGVISYDPEEMNTVSARVSGRIERLYVRYSYQRIRKGQKLMDIYSPDLAAAQSELLFLHGNGETRLAEAARRKLRLLGMTDGQVSRIIRTGRVDYRVTLYSPYSGYLIEEPAAQVLASAATGRSASSGSASMGGGAMSGMSGGSEPPVSVPVSTGAALTLREGQYISAGQKLLSLVDPKTVRAEFYADPAALKAFPRGTDVWVTAVDDPGLVTDTRVSLIQPFYSEGASFSMVRSVISNPHGRWKVGQLVRLTKATGGTTGNWLPRTAVLRTGTRHVAFLRKPHGFVPVYVRVQTILGDWVDIGDSIPPDADVAENAWFLVDSESFIKADSLKQ